MKKKRFAAALASLGMLAAMVTALPVSVSADNYAATLTAATKPDGTAVSQNTVTLNKYLVMDANASVPNAKFNFTVSRYDSTKAAGDQIAAPDGEDASSYLPVFNGLTTETAPTITASVSFAPGDATIAEGAEGAAADVAWQSSGAEKYAVKPITLDFSGVAFQEPGVYRYLITEAGDESNYSISNDVGVTNTETKTNKCNRTLDVYVSDYTAYYDSLGDKTGYTAPSTTTRELFIQGAVIYPGLVDGTPKKDGTALSDAKNQGFTNAYDTYNLSFTKLVDGNQGSKDKYFDFTVVLENVPQGSAFSVNLDNADASIAKKPNNATVVPALTSELATENYSQVQTINTGAETPVGYSVENTATEGKKKVTVHYYLQHGQSVKICGLPSGVTYTVTENAEDYTQNLLEGTVREPAQGTEGTEGYVAAKLYDAANGTITNKDVFTGFKNTREGTIPTGLLISIAAPTIVGLAVIAAIVLLLIRGRRREAEED